MMGFGGSLWWFVVGVGGGVKNSKDVIFFYCFFKKVGLWVVKTKVVFLEKSVRILSKGWIQIS